MIDAGFSILDSRYWMIVIPAKASAGIKRLVYIAISGAAHQFWQVASMAQSISSVHLSNRLGSFYCPYIS